MHFLKNWQAFIPKTYMWVNIEYLIKNEPLAFLPNINMECMI